MTARREASGLLAGGGGLHQTREFPTVCAAERKLLCCWIIMRSRVGTGRGCGYGAMVRVRALRCLEKSVVSSQSFGQCR